ncbi:MAG: peptide-methionine (S)-S-oxide reductase MsrA [Saprospiraceae bacterium]|nr:peptide-methionine (S)-S-oxide reductase MsrA [Saprospiraceae bacterium]
MTITQDSIQPNTEKITLGGGCFWCTEAVYQDLIGVLNVASGYSGGDTENPTYRDVCSGLTGHAEVIEITFDTTQISLAEILDIFWHVHDPTTLNRQGNDVGTQYRSVIFYRNEVQKNIAVASIAAAEKEGIWADKIVTTLEPFKQFYIAENYHQNYFKDNPNQPYCIYVVSPKVEKFKRKYKDKLK